MTIKTGGLRWPKNWNLQTHRLTVRNWLILYATPVDGKLWLVKWCTIEMKNAFIADRQGSAVGLNIIRPSRLVDSRTSMKLASIVLKSHALRTAYFQTIRDSVLSLHGFLMKHTCHVRACNYLWLLWLRVRTMSHAQDRNQCALLRL